MIEIEVIKAFGVFVGVAVLRSGAGWAVKALEDNKVTPFEVKKLVQTVIRVSLISTMAFFSINGVGIPIDALSAAAGAYLFDMLYGAYTKNKTKK